MTNEEVPNPRDDGGLTALMQSLSKLVGATDAADRAVGHEGWLTSALQWGMEVTGAERLGWSSPGSGEFTVIDRQAPTRPGSRSARVAHEIDWHVVARIHGKRAIRLVDDPLRRSCRVADTGLHPWGRCSTRVFDTEWGILWFDASRSGWPHDLRPESVAGVVATLEVLSRRLLNEGLDRRLRSIAHDAGAWIHDLRHAVHVVGFNAERVAEDSREPGASAVEALLDSVADVVTACNRALRGESLQRPHVRVPLESCLVREVSSIAAASAVARRVRVVTDCPPTLSVVVDAATLARVVRNLVYNAVEASADEGAVELSARAVDPSGVELCVRDCGRGMTTAEMDDVLRCGRSGGGGAGFGTTSITRCVRQMGGTLAFESARGRGTTVRVRLPTAVYDKREVIVVARDDRWRQRLAAHFAGTDRRSVAYADALSALDEFRRNELADVVIVRGLPAPGLGDLCAAVRAAGRQIAMLSVRDIPDSEALGACVVGRTPT